MYDTISDLTKRGKGELLNINEGSVFEGDGTLGKSILFVYILLFTFFRGYIRQYYKETGDGRDRHIT